MLHALRDQDQARVQATVLALVDRFPERQRHEDGYIDCITALAVDKELPDSIAKIDAWIEDFASNEGALRSVIFDLQQRLILGFESGDEKDVATRHRASALIDRIIAKIEPTVRELPERLGEPTPVDMVAFKLFSEIADQLYYGVGQGLALRPWSPAHLRMRGEAGGLAISWVRRARLHGDGWETEPPLSEEAERYRIEVLDGGAAVRTEEVTAPAFLYTTAMQAADFPGGTPEPLTVRVSQWSAAFGWGAACERALG